MSRYDQVRDKKSGGASIITVIIILIILASAGWLYFNYPQNDAVTRLETRILALPSGSNDGITTETGLETAIDTIAEIQQENSFILPDLDHSDALLREEITGISPTLAGWLNTDQLIRKYVVIINDFSQGLRLEKHLRFLKPDQPFVADRDNERLFIAATSYQRYDRLAAAINALDVQATLAAYKKLRPLLLQVFKEFSYPSEYRLEDIFTKAVAVILAAPVIDGQIALTEQSGHYKFANQQLEASNPVHKQMLRMGPENTRIIQNKLRSLIEGLVNLKE